MQYVLTIILLSYAHAPALVAYEQDFIIEGKNAKQFCEFYAAEWDGTCAVKIDA